MSDMDALITGLHSRNMKLILDLVINHTSSQHAWFQSSAQNRTGEHADWYIWKNPKYILDTKTGKEKRTPPNNWGANFGGSAWSYVPARDQYYLHLFAVEQPDLNWECEAARQAIHETALRFWFRKGVDGFRVDTASLYSKVQSFPDGKPVKGNRMYPYAEAGPFVANGPRIHEFYREMRKEVLDEFGDPLMVGELGGCDEKQILKYVGSDRRELSMVFDFDFVAVGDMHRKPWHEIRGKGFNLPEIKGALEKTQYLVMNPQGWSTMFAENHDIPRSVSRFGDTGVYWEKSCKLLAMILGTLSGTLFIYQGQEIGMTNIPESWGVSDIRDLNSINYYEKVKEEHPGNEEILRRAWQGIVKYGRDNARTPMQWDGTEHAGFSRGDEELVAALPPAYPPSPAAASLPTQPGPAEATQSSTPRPWMRVNDNYTSINVASQVHSPGSILRFWKKVTALRKSHANLFIHGAYRVHDLENPHTFTFEKTSASGKKALVMLNFSNKEQAFKVPEDFEGRDMRCLISNEEMPGEKLGPWEGRVYVEEDQN
jgi:oligo-1,6-glucosidase